MSTNSDIIVQRNDGKFAVIYCHYDGYVSWNGVRILKYYNTQLNAEALVEPGDIRSLDARPDRPNKAHTFENPVKGHSTYFGRDDHRKQCEYKLYATMDEALEAAQHEYTYLWLRHDSWYVAKELKSGGILTFDDFEVLAQAILGKGDPHDAREAWKDLPDYDDVGHRKDGYGMIPAHRMPGYVEPEFDPSTVPYGGGWA